MKVKGSLTLITLLAATTTMFVPFSARGQNVSVVESQNCIQEPQAYIPAGTLAMLAYRGNFEKEGIPGYNVFTTQYKSGQVTAAEIVQAAVSGCVLSNKYGMAEQKNYISDVDEEVQLFLQGK